MRMRMGDSLAVTLFGESHGPAVGSLVEGMPAGTEIDEKRLIEDMIQRRPGAKLTSKRK